MTRKETWRQQEKPRATSPAWNLLYTDVNHARSSNDETISGNGKNLLFLLRVLLSIALITVTDGHLAGTTIDDCRAINDCRAIIDDRRAVDDTGFIENTGAICENAIIDAKRCTLRATGNQVTA